MDVPDILEVLRNRFAELYMYKGVINIAKDQEIERISEYLNKYDDSDDPAGSYLFLQSMLFRDLETGAWVRYGFSKTTAEEHLRIIFRNENKQYGWLLVEAYEEFEDFLERIYAYMGKTNPSAWYLEDFGRAKLSDLNHKSFDWHLDAIRKNHKLNSRELLSRIRSIYPELQRLEEQNALQVNLRIAIELVSGLRNGIVHSRGVIHDLDDFVERVLTRCGMWNNGNPKPELREFIEMYFDVKPKEVTISLREVLITPPKSPIREFYNVWSDLVEYLIAYAHAIAACVDPTTIQSDR